MLDIKIAKKHVSIGIKGNPPFIDHDLHNECDVKASLWMMEDGELHIQLTKAQLGNVWPCVFEGHATIDEASRQQVCTLFVFSSPALHAVRCLIVVSSFKVGPGFVGLRGASTLLFKTLLLLSVVSPCMYLSHPHIHPHTPQVQQQLLLERFGRENPGFDFSQAEFNGNVPNPREFMGGIDSNRLKTP